MKHSDYIEILNSLPAVHPMHPYQVFIKYRGEIIDSRYVSAMSPARARLTGLHYSEMMNRKKIKHDEIKAVAVMPVELNIYWDKVEPNTNPKGLKLSVYKNLTQGGHLSACV